MKLEKTRTWLGPACLLGSFCLLGLEPLFAQTYDRQIDTQVADSRATFSLPNQSTTHIDPTAVLARPRLMATSDLASNGNLASDGESTSSDDLRSRESTRSEGFPAFHAQPRTADDSPKSEDTNANSAISAAPLITVCSSLAVVLGLFAALVWVTRKYGAKSIGGTLPKDLVELLGTTSLDGRTKVQLIRVGQRVVVAAQTANGIQPLAELTDPAEVQECLAACRGDSKSNFASTLKEIEREPTQSGFAEPEPLPRRKLFASV